MSWAQPTAPSTAPDSWVATDGLGRTVPLQGEQFEGSTIPAPRQDRFVGMFFFLWLGEHGRQGPFDNTEILKQDPDALQKPDSPLWGPVNFPHHWGQSVFGYYLSHDEWVLRRQAQMLSDAGVDVVIFDTTNQLTYPRSYRTLCRAWSQMRKEGNRTPQIAFLTPFWSPSDVVKTLYRDFYKPGIDKELWFQWQGKPLIMADPALISDGPIAASDHQAVRLNPNETLGQSFLVPRSFTGIGGNFPTWNTTNSGVTLSLYDHIGGRLITQQKFENVADNATVSLSFKEPLPAGRYYLEQSEPKGTIGWWSASSDVYPVGTAFSSRMPTIGDRELSIHYVGDATATTLVDSQAAVSTENLTPEIRQFFTFRKPQPSYFEGPTGPNQWGWLEVTPQHVFKNEAGENEQMTVGVAQNATDGKLSVLSNPHSHGRSFHDGAEPAQADFTGRNFNEQWQRALQVDPQFIFVTGWNEWIAGRFGLQNNPFYGAGPVSFVDEFNAEFSRDIEPVRGAHGDAYYYQLVANIRRFKGAGAPEKASAPTTIKLDGQFAEWNAVKPEYRDDVFDTTPRDEVGWNPHTQYINTTGRNDFESLKIARNSKNLFAYARTHQPISLPGHEWMNLLLDSDCNPKTGWMGCDFRINAMPRKNGQTSVEHWQNGGWQRVGSASFRVKGAELELAIPLALLNLKRDNLKFDFKWMDNVDAASDVLNLYTNGDTAPNARFMYRFEG